MTQEEKAKAYDEALKRAKNLENTTTEEDSLINYIFPELGESEDDKFYRIQHKKMSKYIDAEKLKTEIERRFSEYNHDSNHHIQAAECASLLDFLDTLQQEQPEVDLDKFAEKIDNYKARYKYPESISVNGAMAFMARMFYQYPNAARQWYENLPKVTMDDNAKKEE